MYLVVQLSQLIFTVGHIALNILVYIEKIGDSIRKKNSTDKDNTKPDKEKEDADGIYISSLLKLLINYLQFNLLL